MINNGIPTDIRGCGNMLVDNSLDEAAGIVLEGDPGKEFGV